MKKYTIIALILALSLTLTGCLGGGMIAPPETLADGTPWQGTWVNMAGRVGVEKPAGFDLLTTNGALEDLDLCYATWVKGEETKIDKNTYIYEAQVYLMVELCDSPEATAGTMEQWRGQFGGGLTLTDRETVTVGQREFELLYYDCTGTDSHFSRGVLAVWSYDSMVLAADIACAQTMDLDLRGTMTDFLAGFHYA